MYGEREQRSTLVWILLTVILKPPRETNIRIRLMLWIGKKREGKSLSPDDNIEMLYLPILHSVM